MDADSLYRFHHHLVRDTVYGGLLKRARATLHVDFVRWADQVNAERGRALEFEEILGYHLEQAHHYLARARAARREGPGDRRRWRAAPRIGRTPRIRARRHARGRQPVAPRGGAARRRMTRGACRCFPSSAKCSSSSASSPRREPWSTKRSRARRASATAGSKRRRGSPACSCACTAASRQLERRGAGVTNERHPAAGAAGGARRAGQGLAPGRHGPADRRPARQGEARRSPRSSSTRASPATSA